MATKIEGVPTMLVLILLQISVGIVEGGKLQHLQGNERHLPLNHENIMGNNIASDQLNPKFFQNMVNTNHELTAVESHQKTSELQPRVEEISSESDDFSSESQESTESSSVSEETSSEVEETIVMVPEGQKSFGVLLIVMPNQKRLKKTHHPHHHRQKRFIMGNKLRVIAVPLSVFNFLGFLPVRVPGLPYHNDLPPPDYTYYNTKHDIPTRKRYRYF